LLLVEMYQYFGIALGPEPVAPGRRPFPQRLIIVDLAVQDDPERLVFIGNGLAAAGQVDDGQAAEAEAQTRLDVDRHIVGASMGDCRRHGFHVGGSYATPGQDSNEAAHGSELEG
jgi:hypothetical protein